MPTAELHFFSADNPNGSTIFECSTDDEFVKQMELDIQRDSIGSGKVNFARKVPIGLFSRDIVVPETLVRVLIPAVHATKYYSGFWINPRQQQVVSLDEKGGEGFTFAGPGPKHYLTRMLLWSASFSGIDNAVDKDAGVWTWPETAVAGRILERLFQEDAANPSGPYLPDITLSFDENDDSNGDPWTENISEGNEDFTLRIQNDYLKLLWQIEDASGITSQIYLGEVGTPLIRLDAFQTFGRDLTEDVAFVEGHNIRDDLEVEGSSYRKASHALVRGNDGHYELAIKPSWSPGDLKKVMPVKYDSDSAGILDNAGVRALQRQDNGEKQIDLRIVTGFAPTQGRYFPGPDYSGSNGDFWVGDTVSLTTGQAAPTELDYQDEPQVVTGISLELGEAVRDDNDERRARSFDVTVHLNEERKSSNTSEDLAGNRGTTTAPPNVLRLCRPSTFTDPEPAAFIGALGAACSQDDTQVPSDYPPWSGTTEEFVEITSAEDVPQGGTILVGVSTNKDGVNFSRPRVVYDEKGNTYTLDAEGPVQGTSDVITQVWRSVLTVGIVTGDYIRFATQVAGGDSSGRCIAVAAWDSSLTSPDVVTANGASAAPSIGSTPVADITFFSMACFDETVVGDDADWEDTDAYVTTVSGSGANASGLLTQYLQPGDGQGWTSSGIDQSRSFSLAVVGYVSGGTEGGGSVNDGNADLVGTSPRAARCDHRHDVHRDVAPTVDDDFATAGYKLGTIWAQLDDLETPTEIVAIWLAVDVSTGAAVWLEWPGGGVVLSDDTPVVESGAGDPGVSGEASRSDHEHPADGGGGGGATYFSRRILAIASNTTAAAIDINSTTYVAVFSSTFYHDWDEFPATHFQISAAAQSNAAAQTITAQLTLFASPTNPVSAAGNDVAITNTFGVFSSGWVAVSDSMSGLQQMVIAFKGSSATVDLTARWLDIAFKM